MDTGKTIDNFKFFEGFEGEPEVVIEAENSDMQILHIWCPPYKLPRMSSFTFKQYRNNITDHFFIKL